MATWSNCLLEAWLSMILLAVIRSSTAAAAPEEGKIVNFHARVEEFVRRTERLHHREVSWWDLYGDTHHGNFKFTAYDGYKVTESLSSLRFTDVAYTSVDWSPANGVKWVNNTRKLSYMVDTVHFNISCNSTGTWTVLKGLKLRGSSSITAHIGDNLKLSQPFTAVTVSLESTLPQVVVNSSTPMIHYEENVTASPETCRKTELFFTGTWVEAAWELDVFIKGWMVVWFKEELNGRNLWAYPIWWVKDADFVPTGRKNELVFTARGKALFKEPNSYYLTLSSSVPIQVRGSFPPSSKRRGQYTGELVEAMQVLCQVN